MTSTNHSYSHEQSASPERTAMLARAHRLEVAEKYLRDVAAYTDPSIWARPVESNSNVTTPEYAPRPAAGTMTGTANFTPQPEYPRTTTAGNVIEMTSQADHVAAARRQRDEAFS